MSRPWEQFSTLTTAVSARFGNILYALEQDLKAKYLKYPIR